MAGVNLKDIYDALDELAPFQLAFPEDHVGIVIGDPNKKIKKVLVCLTVTPEIILEAIKNNIQLIISHHPIFIHPPQSIREDIPETYKLVQMIKNEIACIVFHTNFDIAEKGLNYILAQRLNLQNTKGLIPVPTGELFKLVTFVPKKYLEKVRNAVCSAGAGIIGEYAYCSFSSSGTGTFLPSEKAKPFLGKIGTINEEEEERFEVLVPGEALSKVIDALIEAHPYEEVAYDVYLLKNKNKKISLGIMGEILPPVTLKKFSEQLKKTLKLDYIRVVGDFNKNISKIGIISGSGGAEISKVNVKLDLLITGDIKYHHALEALEKSICLIDAGHFGTEYLFVQELADYLRKKFTPLEIITVPESDPFLTF